MRNLTMPTKALSGVFMLLVVALLAIPISANAALVTWNINSVTFQDGGTASGSFVYDAANNAFSSIAVTTTAGLAYGGATYNYISAASGATSIRLYSTSSITPYVTTTLYLDFFYAMTDLGGTIEIGYVNEGRCQNSSCSPADSPRWGTIGNPLDNISSTAPVPLPAAAWLLLSGLGGLGFMRKRKAA